MLITGAKPFGFSRRLSTSALVMHQLKFAAQLHG